MRIAQLELIAFGPFRGLEIDFSRPGIHVVFGRNEAGKSTTLRAITGLLYGIPVHTLDAHVHKPADLRVGGTLMGDDGGRLRVIRRKGASKTLLDESGQAIDEALLQRLLRGVTQSTFEHAFGLDLDTLHEGAKALLAGGGDVGGSLFDASVGGGADARQLLKQLTDEADAIYKPRASTLPLNEAMKAFAEAKKAIVDTQRLPDAYVTQENELAASRKRRAEYAAQKSELADRRGQIERARRRIPLERKRAQAEAVLASLGPVAKHVSRIASLSSRLAAYERASAAHREDTAAGERLRDHVAEAARRAGVPAGAKDLRLDVRTQSRIQKYLQERTALTERLAASREALERDERELARLRAGIPASIEALDDVAHAALERAVTQGRKLGDLATRHATETARAARRRADVEAKAKAIGLFQGSVEALVALRPPAEALLDALSARATSAERAVERHADGLARLETQRLGIEQQLAEAGGDFAPPTAADLKSARDARDHAWSKVRDARGGGAAAKEIAALDSAFERAVHEADILADRMIREADRVTTVARLRAQLTTVTEQSGRAVADREVAAAERAAVLAEHDATWAAVGLVADRTLAFAEMRAWTAKHAQIALAFAALREAELDAEESARIMTAARDELAAALATVEPGDGTGSTLVALLDVASVRLERLETTRRAAAEASRAVGELEVRLEERRASSSRDEAALSAASKSLAELISPLGIPDDADADEVTRALDALRELFTKEDQRADVESRASAAGAEARAFEDEALAVAAELAADLGDLPAREIVAQLADRAAKATLAEQAIAAADAQLVEIEGGAVAEDVAALSVDADAAARALEEVEARLSAVEDDLLKETRSIMSYELGLEQMRAETGAAEQALIAQEALERVRVNAERYARARIASVILGREIERYREENQGPLLTKASELFARLTLGGFTGVRAGYNDKDKPALKCVRAGNVEVEVDGLSEGTRDQLYLSLRLASLLRYADLAEPMPLVLDDVLIQFDDERSRAALQIVAEVASRMQVIFFTHHARLVDLARSAVPAASLTVHELSSAPATVASSIATA